MRRRLSSMRNGDGKSAAIITGRSHTRYAVGQKKGTNFLLFASFQYLSETGEFFSAYIEESISYSCLYLILACVKNIA